MAPEHHDRSGLPYKAVWADAGTDAAADAKWLATLLPTPRHYRLYCRESPYTLPQPREPGEQDSLALFGVVVIDVDEIEQSRGGLLLPSPSMIGHLDALSAASAEWNAKPIRRRDPAAPLASYRSVGGSLDAYQFDPRIGYLLDGIEITQQQMRWRDVRRLGPVTRCSVCNKVLPTRYCATPCKYCGTMCYSLWEP